MLINTKGPKISKLEDGELGIVVDADTPYITSDIIKLACNRVLAKNGLGNGGTYSAIMSPDLYVVVVPTRMLAMDKQNQHSNIIGVWGKENDNTSGISVEKIRNRLLDEDDITTIITVLDSLPKVIKALNGESIYWNLMIDEIHIMSDLATFRDDAIDYLENSIGLFKSWVGVTATPGDVQGYFMYRKAPQLLRLIWEDNKRFRKDLIIIRVSRNVKHTLVKTAIDFIETHYDDFDTIHVHVNDKGIIKRTVGTLIDHDEKYSRNIAVNVTGNGSKLEEVKEALEDYDIVYNQINIGKKIHFHTSVSDEGIDLNGNNVSIRLIDINKPFTIPFYDTNMVQTAGRNRHGTQPHYIFHNIPKGYATNVEETIKAIEEDNGVEGFEPEAVKLFSVMIDSAQTPEAKRAVIRAIEPYRFYTVRNGRVVKLNRKIRAFISQLRRKANTIQMLSNITPNDVVKVDGIDFAYVKSKELVFDELNVSVKKYPTIKEWCFKFLREHEDIFADDEKLKLWETLHSEIVTIFGIGGGALMKKLKYSKKNFRRYIDKFMNEAAELRIAKEVSSVFRLNTFYSKKEIVDSLKGICEEINIEPWYNGKKIKSTTIKELYYVKPAVTLIKGKQVRGYKLLARR
jgi:hypothetical protein